MNPRHALLEKPVIFGAMVCACLRLDNAGMVDLEHDRLMTSGGQFSRTGADYVAKQTAYRQSALNTSVIDFLLHEGKQFRYNGNMTAVD